ncbi:MAG: hypothetical protein IPM21_07580 [Acidobacteria bacterium]|nr:hypothetical protein [Acidobacteriota bacterium]
MKLSLVLWILFAVVGGTAQVQLESQDLANLVKVSEIYSADVNLRSEGLESSLKPYRSPKLNQLIDTLVVLAKGEGGILADRYLKRPSDDDLYLWYVIREIHYNRTHESKKPRAGDEVAKETLAKKIDTRWLLDNYYYRIRGGIASHFNDADLSKLDLKIDELGFNDKTERAIFYLNFMEAIGGGRFMVLLATKNFQRILDFTKRFPKFNGKEYYTFNNFDFDDFEWIGYEKVESYNSRHLERLYVTLIAHHRAETSAGSKTIAEKIRKESILSEPKYFEYSSVPDILRSINDSPN